MPRIHRSSCLAVSAFCLLFLAGCGKKTVEVKGKLILPAGMKLMDADPAKKLEADIVKVALVPEDSAGTASGGQVSNADMTFSTREGKKQAGTVPGKYKVTVKFSAYMGGADSQKRQEVFKKFNKFYDATKTPLKVEIGDELEQSITVDLVKNTVTKN
jgi:hypothetical protein